jgi:hypothetical protein
LELPPLLPPQFEPELESEPESDFDFLAKTICCRSIDDCPANIDNDRIAMIAIVSIVFCLIIVFKRLLTLPIRLSGQYTNTKINEAVKYILID